MKKLLVTANETNFLANRFTRNVILFKIDSNNSKHSENKNNDFIALGIEPSKIGEVHDKP